MGQGVWLGHQALSYEQGGGTRLGLFLLLVDFPFFRGGVGPRKLVCFGIQLLSSLGIRHCFLPVGVRRLVGLLLVSLAVALGNLRDFLTLAVLDDEVRMVLAYLRVSGVAPRDRTFLILDRRWVEV